MFKQDKWEFQMPIMTKLIINPRIKEDCEYKEKYPSYNLINYEFKIKWHHLNCEVFANTFSFHINMLESANNSLTQVLSYVSGQTNSLAQNFLQSDRKTISEIAEAIEVCN